MANTAKTLEAFVEDYIKNKAISSGKKSYAGWLISNGVDADEI